MEVRPRMELVEVETGEDPGARSRPRRRAAMLSRKVARPGDVVHVGGLLGVIAGPAVSDAQIDHYVAHFQAHGCAREVDEKVAGPTLETADIDGLHPLPAAWRRTRIPILIHGFGGDLNTWMFNREALRQTILVFALDFPGMGVLETGGGWDLAGLAEVLGGFIDSIGEKKVHLVGHSMGGAVAAIFALKHPDRCSPWP